MKAIAVKHIPIIFLAVISAFWSYFYLSSNALNGYGLDRPEWLLLVDGLIVLPILCFLCVKDKKQAAMQAVAFSCLIILLGSVVIPESSKIVWSYLESLRFFGIAAIIILEISTLATVFFAIRASLTQNTDPDLAISQPIEKTIGKGSVSSILSFEARVWTYALFSKKVIREFFAGDIHFSCHKKDGAQSNHLGFILIMLIELPIVHILLHFLWSPFAANIATGLTIVSLVFCFAEYKALAIRPISMDSENIFVRYGIWNPLTIPFNDINTVQRNSTEVNRSANVKVFNLAGNPNIEITLNSGKTIYLGVDSPGEFLLAYEKFREKAM